MSIIQLAYLGLEVSNMPAWLALAERVLGLDVQKADDGGVHRLRMDDYAWRIALHPGPADDLAYAGWLCDGPEGFEAAKRVVHDNGYAVTDGSERDLKQRRVMGLARFEVGGLPMELCWGPTLKRETPLRFGRPISGFKTGVGGLGHIVVMTKAHEETVTLFRDKLGFKTSDYIWDIVFLRCNSRHHSLAVEPADDSGKMLSHIMLEVNTLDDVGSGWDMVRATDTPFMKTIGKHANDLMTSFYLTTPSGFDIEYGWGGIEVSDASWAVEHHDAASIWGHRRPEQI